MWKVPEEAGIESEPDESLGPDESGMEEERT